MADGGGLLAGAKFDHTEFSGGIAKAVGSLASFSGGLSGCKAH